MGRIGLWSRMELQAISPDGNGKLQFASPGSRALGLERWSRTRYNLLAPRVDTMGYVGDIDITS